MKKRIILAALVILIACFGIGGCAKEPEPEPVTGPFTEDRDVTKEDMELFNSVLSEEQQKTYVPVSVATEIVGGTNYRFYCSVMENGEETEKFAYVNIFVSFEEEVKPFLVDIIPIE